MLTSTDLSEWLTEVQPDLPEDHARALQAQNIADLPERKDAETVRKRIELLFTDHLFRERCVFRLLGDAFVVETQSNRLFSVTDKQAQTVEAIPEDRVATVLSRAITTAVRPWVQLQYGTDYAPAPTTLKRLADDLRRTSPTVESVPGCLPKWAEGLCMYRCPIEPDPTVGTPLFDAFLNRHSDSGFLLAWYWGIYSGEYKGRQNPYSDSDGETGRSTSFKVINDALFGRNKGYASINIGSQSTGSRFVYSSLLNKRLLFIGECKNPQWVRSSIYNEISGGDPVSVEFKYGTTFTATVKAGILTLANNNPPALVNERSVLSRTVPLFVEPFEDGGLIGDVVPQLNEELPGLMWKMRDAWQRLSSNNGYTIATNSKTDEYVQHLISDEEQAFADFLTTHYEFHDRSQVRGQDMEAVFRGHFKSTRSFKAFAAWLQDQPGIQRRRSNGTKYRGLRQRAEAPLMAAVG